MLKTLLITLTNGEKTPSKWAKVFIHATKGRSHYTYHVAFKTYDYTIDISDAGEDVNNMVFGNDPPRWWADNVYESICDLFKAAFMTVPEWLVVEPAMFAEDRWTEQTN